MVGRSGRKLKKLHIFRDFKILIHIFVPSFVTLILIHIFCHLDCIPWPTASWNAEAVRPPIPDGQILANSQQMWGNHYYHVANSQQMHITNTEFWLPVSPSSWYFCPSYSSASVVKESSLNCSLWAAAKMGPKTRITVTPILLWKCNHDHERRSLRREEKNSLENPCCQSQW